MRIASVVAVAGACGVAASAHAATVTFFGEDLNNSATTPLASTPNADAAQSSFLANLVGVGTEDFESFADGTAAPLPLSFPGSSGSITATLSGGNGAVNSVPVGSTNGAGRYATSGTNYWEVRAGGAGSFSVSFSDPVAAFGFFGVDIGDFGGQLQLTLNGAVVENVVVPNTIGASGSTDGSVLYFGVIADTDFNGINFGLTNNSDVFAFDDFTVGQRQQVNIIPLPTPLGLAGAGLFGLAAVRRRRSA